jgi:hypothetical protein
MADNTQLGPGAGGDLMGTDDIGGVKYQRNKLIHGADGVNDGDVSTSNPLPVTLGLTDTQLRANPVPVSGAFFQATQPVSFTWAGLTDTQLRASAVPVSASALPLPAGAATEATLASIASTIANSNDVYTAGSPGQIILARRRDTDNSPAADGDLTVLNMDDEGRLKVASKPASYPDITGDITAIQATIGTPVAGGTVSGDVSRASNIMAFCTGTFAGVNVTFEGSLEASGDANWFGVQAVRSNANTIETTTGVLAAQPAYGWELSVNALRRVRVRCTARTSGTQSWRFVQGTYATEPIPAAQVTATQPVSGTVTANLGAGTARAGFVAGAGIWYDDSAAALAAAATFTGASRDATVTATATAFANAATYAMEVRVAAESDQSGTLWLEVSRDNAAWRRAKSVATAAVTGGSQYAEIVHRPSWRYWRVGFTNGATLQTRFSIGSIAIAA